MILAIETATEVCGVSLVEGGREVAARVVAEQNIHAERLMPLVDEVLRTAGVPLRGIEAVAVSVGPGSFTGLRIGLSTAKGLALSAEKPLILVPTLQALAFQCHRQGGAVGGAVICPVIDAKRDEAFFAFFRVGSGPPERMSPDAIDCAETIGSLARLHGGGVVIAGNAIAKFRSAGNEEHPLKLVTLACHPTAVGILAERAGERLDVAKFESAEPRYLREFVTTTPRRHQRIGATAAER